MSYTQPLVSIVVPCFNGADDIESCISSIRAQTYSHIEIIFVNDASTDESAEIIKESQKTIPITLINNNVNVGAHESVNIGYRAATGLYVTHLDVDDALPHDAIERRIGRIHGSNYDFLLTAEEVHHNGDTRVVYPCKTISEVYDFLIGKRPNGKGINTHAYLAHRDLVLAHNGRPNDTNRHHGDYAFVLKMLTVSNWTASDDVTYIYKRADGILSQNMKHSDWISSLMNLENQYATLISKL